MGLNLVVSPEWKKRMREYGDEMNRRRGRLGNSSMVMKSEWEPEFSGARKIFAIANVKNSEDGLESITRRGCPYHLIS